MNLLARDKHVIPCRIEDELKKLGANYIQAGLWRGFATRDGNLVTGQQNFSGAETAEAIRASAWEVWSRRVCEFGQVAKKRRFLQNGFSLAKLGNVV